MRHDPHASCAFLAVVTSLLFSGACVNQAGEVLTPTSPDAGIATDAATEQDMAELPPRNCELPSWRWLNPFPQGFDLNATWGPSEEDLWFVGKGGTILHRQGGSLTLVKSPSGVNLTGIWGSGPRDIWITGEQGVLLHGDTGCFTLVTSGTTIALRAVFGTARSDVWAVGDRGTVLHFDGQAWFPIDSTATGQLSAVWGSGPKDIWIVDHTPVSALHYDGQRFSRVPMSGQIYSVSGTGPGDVWFAGGGSSDTALAWHFDGSSYSQSTVPGNTLMSITATGPKDVWAVGQYGNVRHYDGTSWNTVAGAKWDTKVTYNSVWHGSGGRAWVVGLHGYIGQVDESGLSQISRDAADGVSLRGMWASSETNVWAVGDGGVILHYDGTSVTKVPSGTTDNLLGIWGSGPDDIWAVGGMTVAPKTSSVLLRWNGHAWSAMATGSGSALRTIWGSSATDVWIGGESLFHWDGSTLSVALGGMSWNFITLSGSGAKSLWAFRYDGALLHFDGAAWSQPSQRPDTRSAYETIWGDGKNDLWLGGQGGLLTHYDGVSWNPEADQTGVGGAIFSFWGTKRDDVWATMSHNHDEPTDPANEVVIHYDGKAWSPPGIGMVWRAGTVYGTGSNVWTVGQGSALIQLKR